MFIDITADFTLENVLFKDEGRIKEINPYDCNIVAGPVLFDLYLTICLHFAVMFYWWRFAKNESQEHSKSRHYNSKYCYSNCYMCSHRWLRSTTTTTVTCWKDEVPITMVVPPLKHKCCHMRVVNYIVDGSARVTRQLLLLAGDVETNPGPGIF